MKKITLFISISIFLISTNFSYSLSPLISINELSKISKDNNLYLIDIRTTKAYESGHIDNSVSVPYSKFRGPKVNPGKLIDNKSLEILYENIGLNLTNDVIIISNGNNPTDFGAAARVYWTLKSSGFRNISILNGGIKAWSDKNMILTKEVHLLEPSELDINFSKKWTATTKDIVEINKNSLNILLLDARPSIFYLGNKKHNAAKSAGTLPDAKILDFNNFFKDGSPLITKESIAIGEELLKNLNLENYESTISFCNTGHWAAINWFVLSEIIQKDNVKLYPGSMVEYTNLKLPLLNKPSLLDNFVDSLNVK